MKSTSFAVLAFLFLLAPPEAGGQEMATPNLGHRLPTLQFQDLAGMTHRIDWTSPESKAIVLFFFEPRGADSFRELVFFDSVCRLAHGLNLEVFAVEGSGQKPQEVEASISRFVNIFQQPAFTVVPDPAYALSTLLNVQRMPSTFLMETHGVVVGRKEGFDNLHAIDLARKMERLLGIGGREELAFERALEERRSAEDSGAPYAKLLAAGARVAPFEFVDTTGARVAWSPAGREGKATVVFFWGALCQPCIREMAYLEQLRSAAGGSALEIIAVEGYGLTPERVSQIMERYLKFNPRPSHSVVADPDRVLSRHFGVGGAFPQTFIIGGDGTVLYHTDDFVQGGERALAGKIELALGLAPGALSSSASPKTAATPPSSAEESPTVLKGLASKGEQYAASLVQAETFYRNRQYAAAIPHYRRCLEFDPKSVAVRERLGEIFQRQGELEQALEQWEKVLQLEAGNTEAALRVEKLGKGGGQKPNDR